MPNELASPYQPVPIKPNHFSRIDFKKNDLRQKYLNDAEFLKKFDKSNVYGWYEPPQIGKDVILYGLTGGNNWQGSAYDPISQKIYIPSNHIPFKIKTLVKSNEKKNSGYQNQKFYDLYLNKCSSCHGVTRNGKFQKFQNYDKLKNYVPSLVGLTIIEDLIYKITPYNEFMKMHNNKLVLSELEYENIKKLFSDWDQKIDKNREIFFTSVWHEYFADDGILASKPPWGTITSITLDDGSTNWTSNYGYKDGSEIGLFNSGGIALTSSGLLVGTGTVDNNVIIKDVENGKTLWKFKMQAEGTAPPLIYNHKGKSYIIVLATGGLYPDSERKSIIYKFGIVN